MNDTDFYAAKADAAFATYDDACRAHGEQSEMAQATKRCYESALIEYINSVELDNAFAEVAAS